MQINRPDSRRKLIADPVAPTAPARSCTGQDGETKWAPLIEFAEGAGEARKQFQQQALDAIRAVAGEEASA